MVARCGKMLYMELLIETENPSIVRLVDFSDPHDELKESLSYKDKKAQFDMVRFKNSKWERAKYTPEEFNDKLTELKSQVKKSILFQDDRGFYTYSGLAQYLSSKTGSPIVNRVVYPDPKVIPWEKKPIHEPYPFQLTSEEELLKVRHGGVEIGTGLGKTLIILNILRRLGLKTIVMTPLTNLSEALYDDLVRALGKKYVGRFYDGKKESGKLIVVANGQSLTRVTPGTEHYEILRSSKVFVADESHSCPATTMESVCSGVAALAPYRFFFSATQTRGDGKTLTLDGITGPIVYKMTVREGVEKGYLAKPAFRVVRMKSKSEYEHPDAMVMNRVHLLYNQDVVEKVGKLVNLAANVGMPTLVLIEEVEQFARLLPYLRHKVGFAHGTLTKDNSKEIPPEYLKSEVKELVAKFNDGKLPVLVGTSCVAIGTDIRPCKMLIYWQGMTSEIQVKQAVGRGTRKPPGKTGVTVVDFDIENVDTLHRHAEVRKDIYRELYPDVQEM
jgi:superfamily II DNA or RNA helicase